MKIQELGHVAFKCRNLGESIKFYQEVFGFEKKCTLTYGNLADGIRRKARDRGDEPPKERLDKLECKRDRVWFVFLKITERQFLELFDAETATEACVPSEKSLNYQHLALIVDDIYEAEKELAEKEIEIDHKAGYNVDGNFSMWLHDPDGNKIELIQYTEKALQFA